MATIKTKKVKTTSKKKKVTPKIEVNTTDEFITIWHSTTMCDTQTSLEEILYLANKHKPKDYPTLECKDIFLYLDKEIDYFYNDEYTSIVLEIKIKNKDYKKK